MLRTVAELGLEQSTPIQTGAIPPALLGSDVVGQAGTGSGRTAAFEIPMVERLDPASDTLPALVLCPTRPSWRSSSTTTSPGCRWAATPWPSTAATRCPRRLDGMRHRPHIVVAATRAGFRDHLQRRWILRLQQHPDRHTQRLAARVLRHRLHTNIKAILRECPKQRRRASSSSTSRAGRTGCSTSPAARVRRRARRSRSAPGPRSPEKSGGAISRPIRPTRSTPSAAHPRSAQRDHGAGLHRDPAPPPTCSRCRSSGTATRSRSCTAT